MGAVAAASCCRKLFGHRQAITFFETKYHGNLGPSRIILCKHYLLTKSIPKRILHFLIRDLLRHRYSRAIKRSDPTDLRQKRKQYYKHLRFWDPSLVSVKQQPDRENISCCFATLPRDILQNDVNGRVQVPELQ
jgi:hypothetical protein